MKVIMVGAGNLSVNLSVAMCNLPEFEIIQVYSRTIASAAMLAKKIGCKATNDLSKVDDGADLYIFALKDDALPGVAKQLCGRIKNGVFVHTAGSVPMSVFGGEASCYGVVYPMQTFSKEKEVKLETVPFFIEASDDCTFKMLYNTFRLLSRNVFRLSSESRLYLHVAAVFACNFSNYCYFIASDLLKSNGIDFDVMLPLIEETALKVHNMLPEDAQTGPAARNDRRVIDEHLKLLARSPSYAQIYEIMSNGISKMKESNDKL